MFSKAVKGSAIQFFFLLVENVLISLGAFECNFSCWLMYEYRFDFLQILTSEMGPLMAFEQ